MDETGATVTQNSNNSNINNNISYISINPLSIPKGVRLLCELCGKVAHYQCGNCRVTFYCTREHQVMDWKSIHEKICQKLIPLRTPSNMLGTEEDRQKKDQQTKFAQRTLLDTAKNESMKYLHQCQYEPAIPAALQALRFSIILYGSGNINIVPAYLLLGEASIGLGRYKQAEEYLSLAKWSVLSSPAESCSNSLRSQLHRNFSKLYAAEGKNEEALREAANDVYYMSCVDGPDSISVSGGYYQIGNIFFSQNKMDNALAMYAKVVDIWYKYLSKILNDPKLFNMLMMSMQIPPSSSSSSSSSYSTATIATGPMNARTDVNNENNNENNNGNNNGPLNEVQVTEALQMFQNILKTRENSLSSIHPSVAESHYVLGMLFRYQHEIAKCDEEITKAIKILEQENGVDHPTTMEVKSFQKKFILKKSSSSKSLH